MKNSAVKVIGVLGILLAFPASLWAQDSSDTFHSLQDVLDTLYEQMIPLCKPLISVGSGLAALGTTWYIAARVWGHISRAEPIDFYPLFKPFFIGFCVLNFQSVLWLINGVLKPTVQATDALVKNNNQALYAVLDGQKSADTQTTPDFPGGQDRDSEKWNKYADPNGNSDNNSVNSFFSFFSIKNLIRRWIAELLQLLYEAAVLCIDTVRTFKLIVLAILGPIAFGLSVFDGFQHTVRNWLARYINVFMWLPVANVFGAIMNKVQLNMVTVADAAGVSNPFAGDTNTFYLIFLILSIVGYFTVPSIASYIIHAGGHALFNKATSVVSTVSSAYTGAITSQLFNSQQRSNANSAVTNNAYGASSADSQKGSATGGNNYMSDKISGKS